MYNKYNSFTQFYSYQPDFYSFSVPKTSYVLGLSYEIGIRGKLNSFKKFIKPVLRYKEECKYSGKAQSENL